MAKSALSFVCQNCGAAYNRWQGKCESCGEWNTLVEEDISGATTMPVSIRSKRKGRKFALETLTGKSFEAPRLASGMAELDRVTGGGFVRGSVLLVGGDPGIGKSTLLTQATSLMARAGHRAVYISGEEATAQVRLRAERLGLADAPVQLASETSVEDIVSTLSEGAVPRLIVIDSIQTMWTDTVESAPGTVTQVRASAQALIRFAKKSGAAIILVGHVTKDGQIAGPRVVEHMVDAVLSFERGGAKQFRILRAVKNSVGPADELGVVGGRRSNEAAAGVAAAAAGVAWLGNAPLTTDAVYFGEISLSGAVRPVAQTSARLKEAAKPGFGRAVLPESVRGEAGGDAGMVLNSVGGLTSLVADIAARGTLRGNREGNGESTAVVE